MIKINIGKENFNVEVATTVPQWVQGLSGRTNLHQKSGLLFAYKDEVVRSFWMKDMNFPIDIILFNKDKKVVGILKDLPAPSGGVTFTLPKYSSRVPITYALEVNAGMSQNINVGDILKEEN